MQPPGNGVGEIPKNGEGNVRQVSRRWYLRLTILVIVGGLTIALFLLRDHIQDLASLGYLGAFVATLASSATIIVPIPGIAVVFVLGNIWNPLAIGLVSGLGSGLGELTGYAAGYSGQELFQRNRLYSRIEGSVARRAAVFIFIFAFVPNPIFDVLGFAAGVLRYPVTKFLFFCILGKTARCILVAYAGQWGLEWVRSWFGG